MHTFSIKIYLLAQYSPYASGITRVLSYPSLAKLGHYIITQLPKYSKTRALNLEIQFLSITILKQNKDTKSRLLELHKNCTLHHN